MKAHLHEKTKLWSFLVLCQKQIKNAMRKNKERNLTWRNSRGQQLLEIFWVLYGVYFMHTICCFEAWEVRCPTLQTIHESKLKQRSYGRLKTTAQSWAKISQPKAYFTAAKWNPLAKFRKVFRSCQTTCKHTCATSQVETLSSQLRTTLRNHLQAANQVANHL